MNYARQLLDAYPDIVSVGVLAGCRRQLSLESAERGRGSNSPGGKRKRLPSKTFLVLPYRQQDRLTVI
jgi:hypothetical protein